MGGHRLHDAVHAVGAAAEHEPEDEQQLQLEVARQVREQHVGEALEEREEEEDHPEG